MQATDTAFQERLLPLVRQGAERSRQLKTDVLVSVTEEYDAVDPLRLFANADELSSDRWFWEHPDGGLAIASAGVMTGSTFPRNVRFSETEWNHRKLIEQAIISPEPGTSSPGPILFSAYSYDPYRMQDRLVWQGFPSSFLLISRAVLIRSEDRHLLTFNVIVGPNRDPAEVTESTSEFRDQIIQTLTSDLKLTGETPQLEEPDASAGKEPGQYLRTVSSAVDAVQAGGIEWVATTRRMKITTSETETFDLVRTIDRLRSGYPEFRTVAAARHGSTFVGLARDTLATLQARTFSSSCSLGSIRRGDDDELDQALATHLASDEHALEQHTESVRAVSDALRPLADSVSTPDEPELRSLDEAHYLYSRVEATLRADATLLQAVRALHPSPAVTGLPADAAYEFLRENEEFERGWFCAPFGWFDASGNGEFVAADRAAVVRAPVLEQQRAYLFAATPVTSSTDPDQQLAESDTRLAALLAALTE